MRLILNNKKLSLFILILISLVVLLSSVFVYKTWFIKDFEYKGFDKYKKIPFGFGVSIHEGVTRKDIQLISKAGLKWVRIDLFWGKIETKKGHYDFKGYDELNQWFKEEGIKPYYILDYSNKLYEENRSIVTNQGREAFANFVNAATVRYSHQGVIWEIWNEPNTNLFWNQQPNYQDYGLLVKKVAPIIRKNDPSGNIVAPALAGINENSRKWLKAVFDQGIIKYIDAVSVHPYRGTKPEEVVLDYEKVKSLIGLYTNKRIPIISGEWGYSMVHKPEHFTEMQQAEYLTRMFLVNLQSDIPISIWYDWKNDGVDPNNREHHFGLLWSNDVPKLAYISLKTLSNTLDGYYIDQRLEYGQPKDFILSFKNEKGKQLLAFWTTENTHYQTIKYPSGKGKLYSMIGKKQKIKWNQGQITLKLSSSPSYLIID
ncbi:cellulase family glycosylhydrolase [Bacillus sp. 03113]|uniref:cellulase family glycosylhydrolase n=1 Tax=Bacillus sp. 03113 TaxID=2578211 RepID=UPI0015E88A46|nr:cellulase family glycosylhydrolase [Bacillus sp. 03113]